MQSTWRIPLISSNTNKQIRQQVSYRPPPSNLSMKAVSMQTLITVIAQLLSDLFTVYLTMLTAMLVWLVKNK
jgi:hypothetical protein